MDEFTLLVGPEVLIIATDLFDLEMLDGSLVEIIATGLEFELEMITSLEEAPEDAVDFDLFLGDLKVTIRAKCGSTTVGVVTASSTTSVSVGLYLMVAKEKIVHECA